MLICFFTASDTIIFTRGVSLSRKICIPPNTDLCYRETKAITAPTSKFAFALLHLFEGTDRIC